MAAVTGKYLHSLRAAFRCERTFWVFEDSRKDYDLPHRPSRGQPVTPQPDSQYIRFRRDGNNKSSRGIEGAQSLCSDAC